jgi:hypothetical protein
MVKTFNTTGVSKSSGGSGIGMLIGVLALAGIGYLIYTSTKKKKEEQKPTYEI